MKTTIKTKMTQNISLNNKKISIKDYFMSNYPAKIIKYKNYRDDLILICPLCNWEGTAQESETIENNSACVTVECPNCEKMLLIAEFPLAN